MTVADPSIACRIRRAGAACAFLGAFGAMWLLWGLITAGLATAPALAALGAGCLAIVVPALRLSRGAPGPDPPGHERTARLFRRVNVAQWAAIAAVAGALSAAGRLEALPAAVSVVVALHFLPLARMFRVPVYYATAAVLLAVDATALQQGGDLGVLLPTFGTGAAIWATAAFRLAGGAGLRYARLGSA